MAIRGVGQPLISPCKVFPLINVGLILNTNEILFNTLFDSDLTSTAHRSIPTLRYMFFVKLFNHVVLYIKRFYNHVFYMLETSYFRHLVSLSSLRHTILPNKFKRVFTLYKSKSISYKWGRRIPRSASKGEEPLFPATENLSLVYYKLPTPTTSLASSFPLFCLQLFSS